MPNEDLTTRLAAQAHGVEVRQRGSTVADLLERQKAEIARALPRHLTTDRFARIALTELRRNERLQACKPASLLGALMQAAQLGLEPGPLGQVYLVPFKDEVTLIVGYRGYIDLFRRSGEGSTIVAREVCEGDHFALTYTNEADVLVHRPELYGDRGPAFAYYGIARFRDGAQLVHVMTTQEIDKHRARSRSKDSGPWVTDYDAMARKTVIRAMSPYLPLSAEVALALESDEGVYTWDGGAEPRAIPPSIPAAGEPEAPARPPDSGDSGAAPPAPAAGTDDAAEGSPGPPLDETAPDAPPSAAPSGPLVGWDDEPIEEERGSLPEAPASSSAGPEEFPPPGDGGGVGPSGPASPQEDRPLEEWPVDWLKAEVDRLKLDVDRRSRQAMIDALANWRIANDPDLFGDEPF